MLTKKYYDGMQIHDVLCESLDDYDTILTLLEKFAETPSIDAVEVRHGKWIEHKERTIVRNGNFIDFFPLEYECSNCGLRRATYSIDSSPSLTNYCPNCGAKMKGADDE